MSSRLRIIAGPNGSGKSTLAQILTKEYSVNLYKFINADVLNAEITKHLKTPCPFTINPNHLIEFVNSSTYMNDYKAPFLDGSITIDGNDYITFKPNTINSYTAAIVADFLKEQYLQKQLSFSFETVFSHTAKVDFIQKAQSSGYKTYMYFIATQNPLININRIDNRVLQGGHAVPEDKVKSRYIRCLSNIKLALNYLDRAYFFDNTYSSTIFLAEYTRNSNFTLHSNNLPEWFKQFVI